MNRVRVMAGVSSVVFACIAIPAAAQDGRDLTGVLVLNGKGYALGRADVALIGLRGDKQQELGFQLTVCAEAPGSSEQACKLLPDDNPASRVSSYEYHEDADFAVISWTVTLNLEVTDGVLKPCFAAGTTLPAHVSCGPTPGKTGITFQLTGGQ
jgi:hypothetical protein